MFSYGDRLRELRKERGFSQEEVALRAEITPSYYGLLERGQANPSVALLEKICEVMSIHISDIFTESNTNLLGIDSVSMQILHQLNGRSPQEKEELLAIIRHALKLRQLPEDSRKK
ncbi:MAG: helix-turn-helix domain-containing protein [Oscillospiraceae bacterium]